MIYLLKSPQIRTYGGVAFEATVMFEATGDKKISEKAVKFFLGDLEDGRRDFSGGRLESCG
jgi:hypothetical protein